MSTNRENSDVHSSEPMDMNLYSQHDNSFQLENSITDCPNNYNIICGNYPAPPPLPMEDYEGFVIEANNNINGRNQTSHNLLNGKTNVSGSGTNSVAIKHKRRSQRKYKSFGKNSSMYRGVTKYDNGRCEAFIWDNTNPEDRSKTTYVGGYEVEKDAAKAHDLAALKLWGESAKLNFPLSDYTKDLEDMKSFTKQEYLEHIKRSMSSLCKTVSRFRGVSRNGQKWQVRVGKGKDIGSIYVGSFDTKEKAAEAYDVAAIRVKGPRTATNFDISNYNVEEILKSPNFLIGKGASKTLTQHSVDDVLEKKRKTQNVITATSNASTLLHQGDQTQTMSADSIQHYPFPFPSPQILTPHGYQNPTIIPQYGRYDGSESMKLTTQLQQHDNQVGGYLDSEFGIGNFDLDDPSCWLDRFLMNSQLDDCESDEWKP